MSIFNNFLDRSRKLELGSFSDNFSRKGYNWEEIKKQMIGSAEEKPPEPTKPEAIQSSLSRESSWSFFNNPKSEFEDRRKRMTDDYRKEMQVKFQEKIEKDKRPRFVEKQTVYNSPPPQIDKNEYSPYIRYNQSQVTYQSYESPPAPSRFEYYSPQVNKKFTPSPEPPKPVAKPEPVYEYAKANLTSDQSRSIRERQLEEWRKSVQAQVEERNKIKEEAKSKKMLEDRLEEAKIKREVDELNKKHQQEIRFETGMVVEDRYEPRTVYEPPPKRPPPKVEEREAYPVRKTVKKQTKPKEEYRVRHEVVLQEAGIRDIIHQIKAEASHAAAERQEIIQDLERMKFELRNTRLYDPYSYSYSYNRPLYEDSSVKYKTFASAGKSIVNGWNKGEELHSKSTYFTKKQRNDYNDIASEEMISQLDKLDQIILSQIEEKEEFNEEMSAGEVREVDNKDESKEDQGIKVFQTELEEKENEEVVEEDEIKND